MEKRGILKKNFREDVGRIWEKANRTDALKARERMIERNNSLTDAVVEQIGGNNAAIKQVDAYNKLLNDLREGKRTTEPQGSLAAIARERMIERQEETSKNDEKHPDIGRDKARRKAYPANTRR